MDRIVPGDSPSNPVISKVQLMTSTEYLDYLFTTILNNSYMSCLLDSSIFKDLRKFCSENYCSEQIKSTLIKKLQDYIYLILSNINLNDSKKDNTQKKDAEKIGSQMGRQISKLQVDTVMKNHWMIQSLNYFDKFKNHKFQLNIQGNQENQLTKLSNEVKLLCNKEMYSMFYLSSYLMKSCLQMESQKCDVSKISQILNKQSIRLKNLFGVKQTNQHQNQIINKTTQEGQEQKIKEFKEKYEEVSIKFNSQTGEGKRKQMEDYIFKVVDFAKQNLAFFNNLLYYPCINSGGMGFKSNLKLYGRENQSSLYRVMQKLMQKPMQDEAKLYPKEQLKNQTIKEKLKSEKQYLGNLINRTYSKVESVTFNVTDILRGKCLFNKASEINNAVAQIQMKIEQHNKEVQSEENKLKIVQIKNRMKGITKDIMLKIKIKDLVCEFQLVLHFKQAENEIHHKMYELTRSKILSSIYLLNQWNESGVGRYFKLLADVLESTKRTNKSQLKQKMRTLLKFILAQNFKDEKEIQTKYINSNQIRDRIQNVQINDKKLGALTAYKLKNSIQYYNELGQYQNAIKLNSQNRQAASDPQTQNMLLNSLGQTYSKSGQYQKALQCYGKILNYNQKKYGQNSPKLISILNSLGTIQEKNSKYNEALKYYQQALKIQQKQGKNKSNQAAIRNNIGSIYCRHLSDYQKAFKQLNEALKLITDKASFQRVQILNNIGQVYIKQQKFSQAIDILNNSLKICEKHEGKNSVNYAQILNSIGSIYNQLQQYEDAFNIYDQSLTIIQKIYGQKSLNCSTVLNNIASINMHQNNKQGTIKAYTKSLQIHRATDGQNTIQYAELLNNMGSAYIKFEQYVKAKNFLEQGMQIAQKLDSRSTKAQIYKNLSLMYIKTNKFDEAKKSIERSLKLTKQKLVIKKNNGTDEQSTSPAKADYAEALFVSGAIYSNMGEIDTSISKYKQSLQIIQKERGKESISLCKILNNLGAQHNKIRKFDEGIRYLERAFKIKSKLNASSDAAQIQNNIGNAYCGIPDYAKALQYLQHSLHSKQELLQKSKQQKQKQTKPTSQQSSANQSSKKMQGSINRDLAKISQLHQTIGCIHSNLQNFEKSISHFEKSLQIKKQLRNGDQKNAQCAQSIKRIGIVYFNWRKYYKSLQYLNKSYQIKKQLFENKNYIEMNKDLSQITYNIGNIHCIQQRYQQGLKYLLQSLKVKETMLDSCNEKILIQLLSKIGCVYCDLSKYDLSVQSFQRIIKMCEKNQSNPSDKSQGKKQQYKYQMKMNKAEAYIQIGKVMSNKQAYDQALTNFYKGLEIRQKSCKENSQEIIDSIELIIMIETLLEGKYNQKLVENLYKVGNMYKAKNDTKIAEVKYQQALDVGSKNGITKFVKEIRQKLNQLSKLKSKVQNKQQKK